MNISSEPKISKYGIQTNILKLITVEDTIHAELKGKNKRLQFSNVAKPIVLANRFLKVNDNSVGWWDRSVVLEFPKTFDGDNLVLNIEKQWIPDEISGIFNWMLEGLYRLYTKQSFSKSKNAEETKLAFMKVSVLLVHV